MDMSTPVDEQASLADLVSSYMLWGHDFVRRPDSASYEALDASFRDLRAAQQRRWPRLRPAVDALGAAACDLVNALYPGRDPRLWQAPVRDVRALVMAHDHAISGVLEAIVPAA